MSKRNPRRGELVSLEEMTRRRDHWRREAELLAEQLYSLQQQFDQQVPELVHKLEVETARRMTAQNEARANLEWVRSLQRTVELLKLGSK